VHKRLFFDLETKGDIDKASFLESFSPPKNYKDEDKIAKWIEDKQAEQVDKMALDPDYGNIAAIGYAFQGMTKTVEVPAESVDAMGKPTIAVVPDDDIRVLVAGQPFPAYFQQDDVIVTEGDILGMFWKGFAACSGRTVGWGSIGFDLPYLMRRTFALQSIYPRLREVVQLPNLSKYRHEPSTDLMMIFYNWEWKRLKGMKKVAEIYEIPIPAGDLNGADVADMDVETLTKYTASDIFLIREIYTRMNGIYFNL